MPHYLNHKIVIRCREIVIRCTTYGKMLGIISNNVIWSAVDIIGLLVDLISIHLYVVGVMTIIII